MARTCGQEGHQEGGVGSEHCLAASEPATSKPCTTVQTEQTLISRARSRRRGCRRGPGCEKGPGVPGTGGECRALYSSAGSFLAEPHRRGPRFPARLREHLLCDAVLCRLHLLRVLCLLCARCALKGAARVAKTIKKHAMQNNRQENPCPCKTMSTPRPQPF